MSEIKQRHGSPDFYKLLEEMAELHDKKSHDYASNDNPTGNYEFAGELSCMFSHSPKDAGFVGRLGEKLYRLSNLEKDKKSPLNESIEDTERDLCVIMVLWMASRRTRRIIKDKEIRHTCAYCKIEFLWQPTVYRIESQLAQYYFCGIECCDAYVKRRGLLKAPPATY